MNEIFIYGTLKKEGSNHHWMKKAKFIGNAKTTKEQIMYESGYGFPFLIKTDGVGKIISGELYEVDEEQLKELDILEGAPDFYKREKIEVKHLGENKIVLTYVKTEKEDFSNKELLSSY